MTNRDKKLLKDTLSLANKRIAIGFYDKKQGCNREINYCPYF